MLFGEQSALLTFPHFCVTPFSFSERRKPVLIAWLDVECLMCFSSPAAAVGSLRGSRHSRQRPAAGQRLLRGRPGDVQLRGGLHAQRRRAPGVRAQLPVEPPPPELRWYAQSIDLENRRPPARFPHTLFIIGIRAASVCLRLAPRHATT